MPHAYTEDQLVEQPAIGLFAELAWAAVLALSPSQHHNTTTPPQRRRWWATDGKISVNVSISSAGETGGSAEIVACVVSLKMAVSPRDENG
jgi:hypothetical protein